MTNASDEFTNSTEHFFSTSPYEDCFNGNHFEFIFRYLIMTLCFIVGTPAHLWCLWFYFCAEQKFKVTQVFFLNYTIIEIIFCLECGIETLNIFIFQDKMLWNMISFFSGLSWVGRPLLQTCICVEQYLAVVHPVTFLRYKAVKYRSAAAAAAWLVAFAYGGYESYAMIFPDYFYTFVFIITLAVISFCCVSVLCALKHPGPGDTHTTKQTGKNRGNQQKRNAFNTIFSALLLIIFTYLPQTILFVFTGAGTHRTLFTCYITLFITTLNYCGVIIAPLLKMYMEGSFKMSKHFNGS